MRYLVLFIGGLSWQKSMANRGTITLYCPRIHSSSLGSNGKGGGSLVSPSRLDGITPLTSTKRLDQGRRISSGI